MDYLVWKPHWQDGWCRLDSVENVEKEAEIRYGLSRAEGFPANACFRMDRDFPNDTMLTDCLENQSDELVVSGRVVEYLKKTSLKHIEYLPVKIFDHRDRALDEPYAIVHPIQPVECLDIEACQPRWNKIIPGQIRRVQQLVLDLKRVDPTRRLFRCAAYTDPKIVHRSLADELKAAGFVGCDFIELESFRG